MFSRVVSKIREQPGRKYSFCYEILTNRNTFQHFIVKGIQNLRPRKRSDMCQSLLGIHPILSYIDIRKLLFLQKLCSLDGNFITK
jgi:hypothetical protein